MILSTDTIVAFFTASTLLAIAPGPDNLFVLAQSARYGPLAGIFVVLGLCTGLLVHTSAVAFGVAALVQASPVAFAILKYLGAAYLLYLAWLAFRSKGSQASAAQGQQPDYVRLYRQGILMNVTNPKVSLFFLALLPQFAKPQLGSVTVQLLLLGGLFIVATIIVFGAIALLAGTLNRWFLRSERGQLLLNRLAGIVFVGLALKIATTKP
jgi:threonine/homoserine/homoserine lactone efflux protein